MPHVHTPSDSVAVFNSFTVALSSTVSVTTSGGGVDTLGYRRALAVFVANPSGTGTTSDCEILESNDNGSVDPYSEITGGDFPQATTVLGATVAEINIDLAKRKRWLKLEHVAAGGAQVGAASGLILLFEPMESPVVSVPAPASI